VKLLLRVRKQAEIAIRGFFLSTRKSIIDFFHVFSMGGDMPLGKIIKIFPSVTL
jgi:hypothetical protein